MARNHARIHVSTYDPESGFTHLDLAHQGLYWMLLARRDINLCGVLPYKPKVWATRSAGIDPATVEAMAGDLEQRGYLVIDRATDEVWVRTFIYHDQVLAMPQVAMVMAGHFDSIDSADIRRRIVASLPPGLRDGFPRNLRRDRKEVSALLTEHDAASYKPPSLNPVNNPSGMGSDNPSCNPSGNGSMDPSGMGAGSVDGDGDGESYAVPSYKTPYPHGAAS